MNKLLLLLTVLIVNVSLAFAGEELRSDLDVFLVTVNGQGEETLQAVKEAEPGQTLEYRLRYTNESEGPFTKLVINGLIPANTEYVANSSRSSVQHQLQVSIDHGKTYQAEPVTRWVKQADGSEKEEVVPVSEYTHLRWRSEDTLPAGEQQDYFYRVRVK